MSIAKMTAVELLESFSTKKISPLEAVKSSLAEIAKENPKLNALITVNEEEALREAAEAEKAWQKGEAAPLCGLPIILKDNLSTKDLKTTAASESLRNYIPPFSATVVDKLKKAGAIILAKANLEEFALGTGRGSEAFGPTKNPHDLARTAGGSSGGSAAAVASFMAPVALGSDSCGSITQPAAYCGICGLAPSYGLVSRVGVINAVPSMDRVGPMARSIKDLAKVLSFMTGFDQADATSRLSEIENYSEIAPLKKCTIALPKEIWEGADTATESFKKASEAVDYFKKEGLEIKEISLPSLIIAADIYGIIGAAEAYSTLVRISGANFGQRFNGPKASYDEMFFESRTKGLTTSTKKRIIAGALFTSLGYYDKYFLGAARHRRQMINEFNELWAKDSSLVIALPATNGPAPTLASLNNANVFGKDIFSAGAALAGLPSLALPIAKDSAGLPLGLKLWGKALSESQLFSLALDLESNFYKN